jgi:aerobic C4-dicarboxylate transport protein
MVLILGVDWFMAQARAMTNMVGNGVATIVIGRWEKEFDLAQAKQVLNSKTCEPTHLDYPEMPATPAEAVEDLKKA